jgi:predicted membrane protein
MPDDQNHQTPQPGSLAEKVAKIEEGLWLKYQTIGGAVLGAAAGAMLFLVKDDGSMLPLNFVLALVLAKFLPDYMEKQFGRSLRRARIALILVMLAAILAYAGYTLYTKGLGAFTAKP